MDKETKLVKKVRRLLRRLGCPRWLHRYGPKTYEFIEHLSALVVRWYARLSYRRTKTLLDLLGIRCPGKSSLNRTSRKQDSGFWQRVLAATSGVAHLIALDATGFSRSSPSYHYLRRIDGQMPRVPVKVSAAYDTRRKKFCAASVRVLPASELRDAAKLLKRSCPRIAVADKGYSSEKLYEFADEQGILLMVPPRRNVRKGFYRRKALRRFRLRTYNRRQIVESAFSSVKRTLGGSVSSRSVRGIRTDVYGRLACHNLFSFWVFRLSGQSRMGGVQLPFRRACLHKTCPAVQIPIPRPHAALGELLAVPAQVWVAQRAFPDIHATAHASHPNHPLLFVFFAARPTSLNVPRPLT